jgi:hypothetical protein
MSRSTVNHNNRHITTSQNKKKLLQKSQQANSICGEYTRQFRYAVRLQVSLQPINFRVSNRLKIVQARINRSRGNHSKFLKLIMSIQAPVTSNENTAHTEQNTLILIIG